MTRHVLMVALATLIACDSAEPAAPQGHAEVAKSTAYTCPMHPEIHEDQPGSCSICGMHLVGERGEAEAEEVHPAHEGSCESCGGHTKDEG